jgi:hypothetical protein
MKYDVDIFFSELRWGEHELEAVEKWNELTSQKAKF